MCYYYITYAVCENCAEIIPGSRGFYNIHEHNPPCKVDIGGRFEEERGPPEWALEQEGGSAQVEREGKMEDCLWCYTIIRDELRELEKEKEELAKAKAKAKAEAKK